MLIIFFIYDLSFYRDGVVFADTKLTELLATTLADTTQTEVSFIE